MKNINIKIVKIAIAVFISTSFLSSCKKDFFDTPDHEGIDAAIWNNAGAIQFYLNKTYDMIMPEFPYQLTGNNMFYASDEDVYSAVEGNMRKTLYINGELTSDLVRMVGTKYQGTNKGDNKYFDIARCNDGIKNIPLGTIAEADKKELRGQFYALRAIGYFDLVRLYGGVPLVLEPQNPSNLTVGGRKSAAECLQSIVNDLDSAMSLLDGITYDVATENGKLTKMAAAALKARVLLYAASPQFNPVNDPLHPYDPAKWQTAFNASKEAYELCIAGGRVLLANYGEIFRTPATTNTEAIVLRSYSATLLKRNNNVEAKARPSEEGGSPAAFIPTLNLVRAYLMKDGTLADVTNPNYDPVLWWKNRDPRLDASIAYNGSSYPLSGKATRRQWTYVGAPNSASTFSLYSKRFTTPSLSPAGVKIANDLGGSGMDWIDLRFAEVIINYAECANEIGNMPLAKDLIKQIRVRAKMEEGAANYGLGLVGDGEIDKMRDLIMNERNIEFALEGKRYADLRRTRRMHLLQGTIDMPVFTVNNPGADGALKKQLEAPLLAPAVGMYRDNLDINNKDTVNKYFTITSAPYGTDNGPFAVPERDYFYGFPNQFLNSSPLLEQTIGWNLGSFDPLKN